MFTIKLVTCSFRLFLESMLVTSFFRNQVDFILYMGVQTCYNLYPQIPRWSSLLVNLYDTYVGPKPNLICSKPETSI
jgi:hypothetical protein